MTPSTPSKSGVILMNWQEIREKYPHRWLVVEAYDAYTEKGKRVINHFEVY
jgi:hypothetical protein